jgi:TonB-dependent receptor
MTKLYIFRKKFFFSSLLVFLLVAHALYAQGTGSVKGRVFDKETGDPLFAANVLIQGTSYGAASNFEGEFLIRNIPAGDYKLLIRYVGYEELAVDITVVAGRTLSEDYQLVFKIIEGETVTITAQAESQIQAINQQLSSTGITNVVSASRIQEVPDANAAESVGRLPGISIKRSSGEGNEVVVRGIQPRLNLITINNIRMPSTNQDNTAVGLAGISQYMLDGIEVRKTLRAEDDADVIGGIVDLKLAIAPEGLHANAILEGMYNGLSEDVGSYRNSVNVSNRFFDSKLGVIAQVNLEKAERPNHALSATYGRSRSETQDEGVYLGEGNYQKNDITRDRFGATLLLDYKLPKGKIQLNTIYNTFDEDRWERNDIYTVNANIGTIGAEKNMRSVYEENYTLVNSLSFETEVFDVATLDVGAAYTTGHREGYTNAMSFWYDGNLDVPINNSFYKDTYGKTAYDLIPNIIDTGSTSRNYLLSRLFREDRTFDENEASFQTNFKVPFVISNQISGSAKVGGKVRLKDRDFDYSYDGDAGGIYGGDSDILQQIMEDNPEIEWAPWVVGTGDFYAYPLYKSGTENILDDKFGMKYFAERKWVDQVVERGKAANWANLSQWGNVVASDLANDYNGDEQFYAGYLMLDLNWGKDISFNTGVRYEKEETDYSGYGVVDIASTPYDKLDTLKNSKRTNEYILPSATLRYNYSDWGDVRVAYSKSLARPEYYAFVPHYSADIRNNLSGNTQADYFTVASGAAGNRHLEPAESNNFDLIFSFYGNYIGLFTVGGFYKEIDKFFYVKSFTVIDASADNQILRDNDYDFAVPKGQTSIIWQNLENTAYIRGLEFSWQTNLWYLPKPLNGIVLGLNYSRISSNAEYYTSRIKQTVPDPTKPWIIEEARIDSFQTTSLIDQPNDIFNVSLGYDYKDFSMRIAYNFQGKTLSYKGEYVEDDAYTQDYSRLDLSIRQKLPVEGLSVQFLMSNLTEEVDMSYTYTKDYNNNEQYYGMTGSLGVRYEF